MVSCFDTLPPYHFEALELSASVLFGDDED
jgi:hypothetical protein